MFGAWWRWVLAGCVALAVVGCTGAGNVDPPPAAVPTTPPVHAASPTPGLVETAGAGELSLDELRASDRYVAIAEHERAQHAPKGAGTGQNAWDVFMEAGWANAEELWDELVGPIRDDALLAGEPATDPIWDEAHGDPLNPLVAFIDLYWSDETTGGRGYAYVFSARFLAEGGEPTQRNHVVLVFIDQPTRAGQITGRKDFFDLVGPDAPTWGAARRIVQERAWDWVQSQESSS